MNNKRSRLFTRQIINMAVMTMILPPSSFAIVAAPQSTLAKQAEILVSRVHPKVDDQGWSDHSPSFPVRYVTARKRSPSQPLLVSPPATGHVNAPPNRPAFSTPPSRKSTIVSPPALRHGKEPPGRPVSNAPPPKKTPIVSPPAVGNANDPPDRPVPNDPPPRNPPLISPPALGHGKEPPGRPTGRPIPNDRPGRPIIGRPVPNNPPGHPIGHPAPNDPPGRPIIGRPVPNDPPGRPIGHPIPNDPPGRPIGRPVPNDPRPGNPPLISPPYIGTGKEPPGRPVGHPVKPPADYCRDHPRKCYIRPPVVYDPWGCDRYNAYNWRFYYPRSYGNYYSPWSCRGFSSWGNFNSWNDFRSDYRDDWPDYRGRSLSFLLKEGYHPKVAQALWDLGFESRCIRRSISYLEDRNDGFYEPDRTANDSDQSAVVDLCTSEMSEFQIRQMLEKLGQKGFAAWYRQPGRDGWGDREESYIYAIYAGVPVKSKHRAQILDYLEGRNGLSNHAPYQFYQWSDRAMLKVSQLFEESNS